MPALLVNLGSHAPLYTIKSGNMVYNSFQTSILTRITLLVVNITALAYLYVRHERFFTLIFLALLAILQIVLLFVYLNKTNRNLARFLLLLTYEDTSVVHWKDKVEKTFHGLHHSFKKVNDEINRIRLEKEKGSILLKGIIQHMEAGIMVADESGRIEVVNDAALLALGVNQLDFLSDLDRKQEGISQQLSKLGYDSGNVIHYQKNGQEDSQLLVRVSLLKLEDRALRIYSLQDIKNQLEANEIESWQKMTRVLSHEISNSVTPISTLGDGIRMKLKQGRKDEKGRLTIEKDAARDLLQSSELIQKRSDALVEFMEHYKHFSRLPTPIPGKMVLAEFLEGLAVLFTEDLKNQGIRFEVELQDPSMVIHADRNLMEQAFINLVRNCIDALNGRSNGLIQVRASLLQNRYPKLEISDNGTGISPEHESQVFIPFFTTKQKGTGIGLSIVRKIINMHGGTIQVDSSEGRGSTFVIRLPQNLPEISGEQE
jgi:two-component system nitrogen regulation sensor histidine kinase NtrY